MHSFVNYLYHLLRAGVRLAIPAALVCGVILAVCYAVFRRRGRRFPWGKAVCALLLVGWAAVTVFVTLLRGEPGVRMWNFQLFLAWREAYQRFTLQLWLNVLLNIALFIPPGVLLPLLWKPFRRWYAMLLDGFGCSLLIELMQLLTARGMCDVDDLFTNTLGTMLGWCVSMLFLSLREKSRAWKRYLALPAAFAFALSAIFISYAAQPYGNLRDAAVTVADLREVSWSLAFAPDEGSRTAWVYQAQALDNAGADRFAALAPVRKEPVLSPAQAVDALQAGRSFEGAWFAQSAQRIEVRSCALDYLSDSKGFYQPVYRFELSLSGQADGVTDAIDYVPALF